MLTETSQQLEGHFCRMLSLDRKQNHLLLTNYGDGALNIIDTNGNLIRIVNLSGWLSQVFSVCSNVSTNEIFVNCYGNGVFVFDKDFNYLRNFGKGIMGFTSFMILDHKTRERRLYASNYQKNQIGVWHSGLGKLIETIKLDRPDFMVLINNSIYVTSSTSWSFEWKLDDRVLTSIHNGSNGIYELDKNTYELIKEIKFDYWLEPRGLQYDSNFNILTLAYELDPATRVISETRSIFVINKWGNCVNKIKLYSFDNLFWDMLVIENKLLVLYQNQIKTIEFYYSSC
jgi:hypothetical protein